MKFDKQLAIILVLVSMLLSAIAISFYFYTEKEQIAQNNSKLVTIFVAKENIKKNSLITDNMIKQTVIARQYVLTKPLLKNEIVGKYAKESLYQNEAFLKEKLSNKIEIEEAKTIKFEYNSYNMSMKLFQNPNYSIFPGDIIKIISVFPREQEANRYSVQYVAKNIRVLGFLTEGEEIDRPIYKKKVKRLVNKKQVEELVDIKVDEVVLDIKEKILLKLINDYNKGKQLWMVKSKVEDEDEKIVKISTPKTKTEKKYKPVKRTYPLKWYKPKQKVITKTAVISYANSKDKITKKAKIVDDLSQCEKSDKLLLGTSNNIYLRNNPSYRAKIHKKVYKNYILPYIEVSNINTNWYRLCDGSYVNKKDVKIINQDQVNGVKR